MRPLTFVAIVAALLSVVNGCSRAPSRILPPSIDAQAPANAIAAYDDDKDGVLSEKELEMAPPLKAALKRIDANGDRKLDAAEIDGRITAWRDSKVGLMPVTIRLNVNGKPLAGADVKLVPEKFLGEALKPATGTTNQHGVAVMQISNLRDERGVQSGFYRIEVSRQTAGKESIPARYNAQTQLGLEIEPVAPDSRDASFNLTM